MYTALPCLLRYHVYCVMAMDLATIFDGSVCMWVMQALSEIDIARDQQLYSEACLSAIWTRGHAQQGQGTSPQLHVVHKLVKTVK